MIEHLENRVPGVITCGKDREVVIEPDGELPIRGHILEFMGNILSAVANGKIQEAGPVRFRRLREETVHIDAQPVDMAVVIVRQPPPLVAGSIR